MSLSRHSSAINLVIKLLLLKIFESFFKTLFYFFRDHCGGECGCNQTFTSTECNSFMILKSKLKKKTYFDY